MNARDETQKELAVELMKNSFIDAVVGCELYVKASKEVQLVVLQTILQNPIIRDHLFKALDEAQALVSEAMWKNVRVVIKDMYFQMEAELNALKIKVNDVDHE